MLFFSLWNLSYLVDSRPLLSPNENLIELMNELTIWVTTHLLTNFLNIATPQSLTEGLGWIFIAFIGLNIIFNLVVVG